MLETSAQFLECFVTKILVFICLVFLSTGKCEISYKNKMLCRACRFQKCAEMFPEMASAPRKSGASRSLSYDKLSRILKTGSKASLKGKEGSISKAEGKVQKRPEERERKQERRSKGKNHGPDWSDLSPLVFLLLYSAEGPRDLL